MSSLAPSGIFLPRASGLGAYLACLYRAAQDRLRAEGRLPLHILDAIEPDDTRYADLGTCIHFTMQDGIGGWFPQRAPESPDELAGVLPYFNGDTAAANQAFIDGDPRAYQPTPIEWQGAERNFGGNKDATLAQVRAAATLGARYMPKSPDGQPWLVEPTLRNDVLSGHMDFLSQCETVGGDLKTTSQPPYMSRLKPQHLAQMCSYKILKPSLQRIWVLYLDSKGATWAALVWIDFTKPEMMEYVQQVRDFIDLLRSDDLFRIAYPNLGEHCIKTWCPYRKSCYDAFMPPPGRIYDAAKAARPTGPMRLTPMTPAAVALPPSMAPAPPTPCFLPR